MATNQTSEPTIMEFKMVLEWAVILMPRKLIPVIQKEVRIAQTI